MGPRGDPRLASLPPYGSPDAPRPLRRRTRTPHPTRRQARTFKSVQRELREAQVTLAAKDRAITAYDTCFTGVATTHTGLLRQAGDTALAAKVRPSARRPGQTAAEAGDTPDPTPPTPTPDT